ncbi:hypothetical protein GCM10022409_12040 [Hymenobacter glaciei]|uniref:Glycosyltransferase 2-like domain-containing protein n=1 Tax=Hymenobacter glaciei TaxID=877209 RepID=A0ABP7TRL5_9BACT
MSNYKISYVVTTYNKLPYLKQVLERLVAARLPDEEIVVTDGGSKDGTPDYLRGLHEAGHIQQFVSERDKGESHGFNKAMLMARGQFVKIITDDDAFCYPAIRQAANFMVEHPAVDVATGHTGLLLLEDLSSVTLYEDVADNFRRWLSHKEVVWMIGLPLLIRRTSLSLTGLFNTGVVQMDTEFTYRITSLNVNIAWCSHILSMRIENPQSNFRVMNQGKGRNTSVLESNRMRFYYDKGISDSFLDFARHKSGWVESLKAPIRPAKRLLFETLKMKQYEGFEKIPSGYQPAPGEDPLGAAFRICDNFMKAYNEQHPLEFLHRDQPITKALDA